MRLYGRWRPLSSEVQRNLCGREAVSYRCRVLGRRDRMKPYNATLPNRWIWRAGAADEEWMTWPPRSPVLTPCDFFLWSYVKEQVFLLPLPLDIDELELTITAATETIDRNVSEYGMSWTIDWTFVGPRMELTLSIFRVCKTFTVCHSNGTSYNCIALIYLPWHNKLKACQLFTDTLYIQTQWSLIALPIFTKSLFNEEFNPKRHNNHCALRNWAHARQTSVRIKYFSRGNLSSVRL
jgi:hypothetical protein